MKIYKLYLAQYKFKSRGGGDFNRDLKKREGFRKTIRERGNLYERERKRERVSERERE